MECYQKTSFETENINLVYKGIDVPEVDNDVGGSGVVDFLYISPKLGLLKNFVREVVGDIFKVEVVCSKNYQVNELL